MNAHALALAATPHAEGCRPSAASAAGILQAMPTTPASRPLGARRSALAWTPVVAWAALIFVASAQPNLRFVEDAGLDFVVRKIGHMGVFGILALLVWRALATTTHVRRPGAWAMALTALYAITDELHQGAVIGRHASPVDVGIDTAGALIAIGAVAGMARLRRGRPTQG